MSPYADTLRGAGGRTNSASLTEARRAVVGTCGRAAGGRQRRRLQNQYQIEKNAVRTFALSL